MTTYFFVNAMKQPHKFAYINVGMSDSTLLDFTRQSPYFHIQNHSNYSLMTPLSCTIVLNQFVMANVIYLHSSSEHTEFPYCPYLQS